MSNTCSLLGLILSMLPPTVKRTYRVQTFWLNISSFAASYLFDSAAAQQKQNV